MMDKLSELDKADPDCKTCGGDGWVCEDHPDRAWPEVCKCGGAGMPCNCNPLIGQRRIT